MHNMIGGESGTCDAQAIATSALHALVDAVAPVSALPADAGRILVRRAPTWPWWPPL